MSEETKLLNEAARAAAERTIDSALGAMNAAAEEIGQKYGIPDNVGGNSRAWLLGRPTYVPVMPLEWGPLCGQAMPSAAFTVPPTGPRSMIHPSLATVPVLAMAMAASTRLGPATERRSPRSMGEYALKIANMPLVPQF